MKRYKDELGARKEAPVASKRETMFDFTRCQKPNGKIYGSPNRCRPPAVEIGPKVKESPPSAREGIQEELNKLKYDLITYHGDKSEQARVSEILRKIRDLLKKTDDKHLVANTSHWVGVVTNKIKISGPGSFKQVSLAGKSFLRKYENRLKYVRSTLERAEKLEVALRDRSRKVAEEGKPGWIKEKLRLSSSIKRVARRRRVAESRLSETMVSIREDLLRSRLSDRDVSILVDRVKFSGPNLDLQQTRKHVEEFVRMFNGKGLSEVNEKSGLRDQVSAIVIDSSRRAYAIPDKGYVVSNGTKQTLFHELGHVVEGQRGWLRDFSERWRDTRAFSLKRAYEEKESQRLVGDGKDVKVPFEENTLKTTGQNVPVFRLKDMVPLRNFEYREDEKAVVDTFLSPYLGKMYDSGWTEIVSSTMEHFSEPYLMGHLFKRHPDLFYLGVGLAST